MMIAAILVVAAAMPTMAQQETDPQDAVTSLAEEIGDTAGRLLAGAQSVAAGDGTLTVSVGGITYDDSRPRIASLLAATIEDSLVAAAQRMAGTRDIAVRSTQPTDLVLTVRGGGGPSSVLLVVQVVSGDGTILASSRVSAAMADGLAAALAPAPMAASGAAAAAATEAGDDVPDRPENAQPVTPESVLQSLSLEEEGDHDWFVIDVGPIPGDVEGLPALTVYTSGTTDTYIEAFGPDDPQAGIAENDDTNGTNARVSFPVESDGRYWIMVRGFADSSTGTYDLHVVADTLTVDDAEPNNSRETATDLQGRTSPLAATIRPSGDSDWYRIDPASAGIAGDGASADARSVPALRVETQSTLDTTITVYDANGDQLTYNDDGGEGSNARVLVPAGSGPVYVEVRGYGDWVEGDYQLLWGSGEIQRDAWEPDDTRDQAQPLEIGSGRRDYTFSNDSDSDWVSLSVPESSDGGPSTVVIETYGDVDTYMRLTDADGNQIDYSDDDGSGFNARIDAELEPGTYYVELTPLFLSGEERGYSVEARLR